MLFWNTTRDLVRSSAWKDITQEIQSNTWKVSPFFIPEVTSVPDLEEIQDSKRILNIYQHERSVGSLGFQQSSFQVVFNLGNHFGVI